MQAGHMSERGRGTNQTFRTLLDNVYAGTHIDRLRPVFESSIRWGSSLAFTNEAGGRDITGLWRALGWRTIVEDQYRLSWDPKRWALEEKMFQRLSDERFFKKDGKTPQWSEAIGGVFRDLDTDFTLEAWTYHTPAHIQGGFDNPGYPERRYAAFIESMLTLADKAKHTDADGFLAAGDDNWDEDGPKNDGGGPQTEDTLSIMLGRKTGLRQIQAGEPTFGPREIDDYRIRRLRLGGRVRPTGVVKVMSGGGSEKPQHQAHMREWEQLSGR